MALNKSAHAKGIIPTPVAAGCELVVCRAEFSLSADLAVNDLIQMMYLPAGHVPVDIILDNDALGAGTVAVGILNAGGTDIDTVASGGAPWLAAGAVTTANGLRADAAGLRAMARCPVNQSANQAIGVKIVTDTSATSGTVGLTLFYRSA